MTFWTVRMATIPITSIWCDGIDVIRELRNDGFNRLLLGEEIAPNDIHVDVNNNALNSIILSIPGTGDRIELIDQLRSGDQYGVDEIEFFDGTIWNREDLVTRSIALQATRFDDRVDGSTLDDVIEGGVGK